MGTIEATIWPACAIVPTTCERGRHSGTMSAMDLPRKPKSGAASAVPESLFQKSQVPHERVPRDRWASPGIVNWSRLTDFRECFCGTTVMREIDLEIVTTFPRAWHHHIIHSAETTFPWT